MSKIRLHYLTFRYIEILLLIASGLAASGCLGAGWDQVQDSEDIDELRSFIQDHQGDLYADYARQRIELLEFRAAVRANSRYAYTLFVERHPESVHAHDARRRLEDLDFEQLQSDPSEEAILRFLQEWPRGRHVDQARALLARAQCQQWLGSGDPAAIREFLGAHPGLPCVDSLEHRREDLLFARGEASAGTWELVGFLEAFPAGRYTTKAREILLQRQLDAILAAAKFERAEELVKRLVERDRLDRLLARIDRARTRWLRASFDPAVLRRALRTYREQWSDETARELERRIRVLAGRPGRFRRLARAVSILRTNPYPSPVGDSTLVDPRERWLEAVRLSHSFEEETAEYLLGLMADSFIEVRRRGLASLRQVVNGLGVVRAESWLATKHAQLRPKARSGLLLFKLAVIADLAGRTSEAFLYLERHLQSSDNPDLSALSLSAEVGARLGRTKDAATSGSRFARAAAKFANDRIQAWSAATGLSSSQSGWLTLRQLHGLANLWVDTLRPFEEGKVSSAPSLLGPWLAESGRSLNALTGWLEEEEEKWKRYHPGFSKCGAPAGEAARPGEEGPQALDLLALAGEPDALVVVRWTACCHADPPMQLRARSWIACLGFCMEMFGWVPRSARP